MNNKQNRELDNILRKQDDLPEEQVRKHQVKVMCWRAFKTDHLCALNFDQAFLHRI